MIRHQLQDRVQVHHPKILQQLDDRFAGPFEFRDHFLVLQVVDQVLFLDQRQQRTLDLVSHSYTLPSPTTISASAPTACANSNSCSLAWIVIGSCALVTTSSRAIIPARYFSTRK